MPAVGDGGSETAVAHARRAVLIDAGRRADVEVLRHEGLLAGQRFEAPSIVEYAGGTLFVPPGWRGRVDQYGNVHLSRAAPSGPAVDASPAEAGQEVMA